MDPEILKAIGNVLLEKHPEPAVWLPIREYYLEKSLNEFALAIIITAQNMEKN